MVQLLLKSHSKTAFPIHPTQLHPISAGTVGCLIPFSVFLITPFWCRFSKQDVSYILSHVVHYSQRWLSGARQNFRKLFLMCFHFHFLKWHWKVQRDAAARVWGVWTPVCHHLNVTQLRGGRSWQQLPLSTIMCELAFDPSVKRKEKTPHTG